MYAERWQYLLLSESANRSSLDIVQNIINPYRAETYPNNTEPFSSYLT
jgi:hypothetical protein